jgi:spermidine synthase
VVALPFALGCLPLPTLAEGARYTAPDGDAVQVLAVRDSPYARLVVLEKGSYRLLVANGIVQTGVPGSINSAQKADALSTHYFQELLPYTVDDPAGRRALIIGLAGGMTASLLRQYDMEVDSVDLDPAVIELARRHFWFQGPAVVADGRRFLESCTNKYDFCVIDTYSGDVLPFQLCSVEAFRAAKAALTDDGILALNFIGMPSGLPFACVYRTLQAVFPHVRALRGEDSDDVQTITLFAASRRIEFNNGWTRYRGDFRGVDPIADSIRRLSAEPSAGASTILTDDHNPIDSLRADEALRWRERTASFIGSCAAKL